MYLCKFGQNPSTGTEDNIWGRTNADGHADADRIHTKSNMSSLFGWGGHKLNFDFKLSLLDKCVMTQSLCFTCLIMNEYNKNECNIATDVMTLTSQ